MLAVRGRRGRDVAGERRAGLGDTGLDDVSRRQKALICSDFCRLADAKPTCVAAKTRNSLARTPTWADATGGGAALQSVRELEGDSQSEDRDLTVDRFQGSRSVVHRADQHLLEVLALQEP